jgi:hypothetical protein
LPKPIRTHIQRRATFLGRSDPAEKRRSRQLENWQRAWKVFLSFVSFVSFDERGSGPLKLGQGGALGRLCIEGVDQNDPDVGDG